MTSKIGNHWYIASMDAGIVSGPYKTLSDARIHADSQGPLTREGGQGLYKTKRRHYIGRLDDLRNSGFLFPGELDK